MQTTVFGVHDDNTMRQFERCLKTGNVVGGVLCADGHYGYSQPVGGVIVYDGQISPSGVGYDIACGNKAVKTNLKHEDIKDDLPAIMDEVARRIVFGVGRDNVERVDHALFDDPDWAVYREIGKQEHDRLYALARKQLGTAGSGNHFVDILIEEETGDVWLANHFGSRGFGHLTATGFLNLAHGRPFLAKAPRGGMDDRPTLLDMDSELGDMYYQAMRLAGRYAYAGRDVVMEQLLSIVQAEAVFEVHNNHNYAWKETHGGREYIVVRKGATPAAPGQLSFIGGSMGDISVIIRGKDSAKSRKAFYSTVHGAGRIMSRRQALGKFNRKTRKRTGGRVTPEEMHKAVREYGVELRGAGPDESPFVYRKLRDVLDAHAETIEVLHVLRPIGVCMDGA